MLKTKARTRYRQKHAGIIALSNPGRRLSDFVCTAAMTRHPSARQTVEVALLERFSNQSVIAMNATFTRMSRFVRRILRSGQCVTVSQKKKSPLIRQTTPSMFLLVVAPRSEEHTSELQSLRHLVC